MEKSNRRITKGMDDFLPAERPPAGSTESQRASTTAARRKQPGGRPSRTETGGAMDKGTFRIPVKMLLRLEKAWLKVRSETGKKISKSSIVCLALDEILPRLEKGEVLDRLDDYLG